MNIGINVGHSLYQIGRSDYLDSLFSTIAYYLENKKWGSVYPTVMLQLYKGEVSVTEADKAIEELKKIQDMLESLEKNSNPIIWDARDLSIKAPEWAINSNDGITNLRNYYVTPDGRDLIELIITALMDAKNNVSTLIVQPTELKDILVF